MKRHRVYEQGEYQVWAGTNNTKKRGAYFVYWKGIDIGRNEYLYQAQWRIQQHQREQTTKYTPKPKPLTPETDAWLEGQLQNGSQ